MSQYENALQMFAVQFRTGENSSASIANTSLKRRRRNSIQLCLVLQMTQPWSNRLLLFLIKLSEEEAYWRQRSILMWLSLGDRNTWYFHAETRGRRRRKSIAVLETFTGEIVYKEEDILKVVVSYYQELFTSKEGNRTDTVNYALKPLISAETNANLIEIPSAIEIKEAIFSVHADKAPEPDGFSASFFQSNWTEIGAEIVTEIQGFFTSASMPPKMNETHVCLIPKIANPQRVADYRSIALCNVYYKTISKLITKQLQPLLEALI